MEQTLDNYRQEQVQFHQDRFKVMMLSAKTLKRYALQDMSRWQEDELPMGIKQLIAALVNEAHIESQVIRWMRHAPDRYLQEQKDQWSA